MIYSAGMPGATHLRDEALKDHNMSSERSGAFRPLVQQYTSYLKPEMKLYYM